MQIRHFRRFVQTTVFLAVDKNTVYQKHGLCHPELWHKFPVQFSLWGGPQSADRKLFEQEAPKIGTQKCSTKRGAREPLHVEFALKTENWSRQKCSRKE